MSPEFLTMVQETANMFAFLAIELTMLFLVISYFVVTFSIKVAAFI